MSKNADNAVGMFQQGFNCAQSVLGACGESFGLNRETALRVAQAFGGGMCYLGQTCGAATGAFMVVGLRHAKTGEDNRPKQLAQQMVTELAKRFKARNGSILCNELLGCDLGTAEGLDRARQKGLFKTLCPKFVRDAVEIVEELLGAPPAGPAGG